MLNLVVRQSNKFTRLVLYTKQQTAALAISEGYDLLGYLLLRSESLFELYLCGFTTEA